MSPRSLCGNHGCVFGSVEGMGTNGRCTCLDPLSSEVRQAVLRLLAVERAVRESGEDYEGDPDAVLSEAWRDLVECRHMVMEGGSDGE